MWQTQGGRPWAGGALLSPVFEMLAGVLVGVALLTDRPVMGLFVAAAWVLQPVGWSWGVAVALGTAAEVAAWRIGPKPAASFAVRAAVSEVLGLAAMGMALGAVPGAAVWWVTVGQAIRRDGRAALGALMRGGAARVLRAGMGLVLVYGWYPH
jgi:hypothetical protein